MTERKYSIDEIDRMRRSLEDLMTHWQYYGSGASGTPPKAADVEEHLRTHMQNGTEPEELEAQADRQRQEGYARGKHVAEMYEEMRRNAPPPPPPPRTVEEVIERWYASSVAHYEGASDTLDDLYDGFTGSTLKRYANRHAPDGVNITKRDLEKFLDRKGIKARHAMFAKRYDGIMHVLYGDVRSGNYST